MSGSLETQGDILVAFSQPANKPNPSYLCTVEPRAPAGPLMSYACNSGGFIATNLSSGRYLIQVHMNDSGETSTIRRGIRVATDVSACQPYLINSGRSVADQNVTLQWSSTGSPIGFWCKLDGNSRFQCKMHKFVNKISSRETVLHMNTNRSL